MSSERFTYVMDTYYPSYQWDQITVTTVDSYILTLFRVYNETALDDSKGPVLF